MSQSNYPNGFPNGVIIRGVPLQQAQPGEVYWVNNSATAIAKGAVGGSDGNSGTYTKPFSTIQKAIDTCVAGRGDTIMVMPGHAESISSAGALTIDKNKVAIVGLGGQGGPSLTLDTANTASIVVSGSGCTVKGFNILGAFADIATCFDLQGGSYFNMEDLNIVGATTNQNFVDIVTTSTTDYAESGLRVANCNWKDSDTGTGTFCAFNGSIDTFDFVDNYINIGVNTSDLPAIAAVASGKLATRINVTGNSVWRLNDDNPLLITGDGTMNGIVADNFVRHADTAGEVLVTAGKSIGYFNNYATAANDASGFLLPAADS